MSVSVSQRQFGVGGIRPMNDRERCGRRERINSGFYTSVSSMELELWVLHLCVMHGTGTLGSDVRWLSFLISPVCQATQHGYIMRGIQVPPGETTSLSHV